MYTALRYQDKYLWQQLSFHFRLGLSTQVLLSKPVDCHCAVRTEVFNNKNATSANSKFFNNNKGEF